MRFLILLPLTLFTFGSAQNYGTVPPVSTGYSEPGRGGSGNQARKKLGTSLGGFTGSYRIPSTVKSDEYSKSGGDSVNRGYFRERESGRYKSSEEKKSGRSYGGGRVSSRDYNSNYGVSNVYGGGTSGAYSAGGGGGSGYTADGSNFVSSVYGSVNSGGSYSGEKNNQQQYSNGGYSSGGSGFSSGGGYGGGITSCGSGEIANVYGECVAPIVTRNIFVYAAPKRTKKKQAKPKAPQPKLDYNIVFIRTPDFEKGEGPIVIPPPQQKTIVYVLNKNGEIGGQQIIEVPAGPHPNPEVFYVNYNDGDNPTLPGGISLQEALSSANAQQGQVIEDDTKGGGGGGTSYSPPSTSFNRYQ